MSIPVTFGELVFNDAAMKARLPAQTYLALKDTIRCGKPLEADIAGEVAAAMKDWAVEKGATHYTHWFQPLTGCTAEKHDGFLSPGKDGAAILEFSAKELIMSEPDASSFPSGGLRATFEARGYTAWDPTSPAFIKRTENGATLCIPTAFCSYKGQALDKKTPLLRSMTAVTRQARRLLSCFGGPSNIHVSADLGAEQEYFLVDKQLYALRPDLMMCGRTLFGNVPPKHQQMEDHYFGSIKDRVLEFMVDVDEALWKLGIPAKTRHNEVAPGQFEIAPIFESQNLAVDHNMLVMEVLRKTANKHDMVCLLHEKPFSGMNGSGKHNNWSLATDTGKNLFSPGKTPRQNAQFLVFLAAFIQGVDEYQDFLRCTVAYAGNDHRLGADEAPPAIVSIFLGDELNAVVQSIIHGTNYQEPGKSVLRIGVDGIPAIPQDTTDRNRTSPLAFTGNKFEFRMVGSSQSIAGPNIALNTIMAEQLCRFADALEKADDFDATLQQIVSRALSQHQRIIFDGNGYSEAWKQEAARRGLSNLPSTAEALPAYVSSKNIDLVERHGIFNETEFRARYSIHLESYRKVVNIEARTMVDMAMHQILPAAAAYSGELCQTAAGKKALGVSCRSELDLISKLSESQDALYDRIQQLIRELTGIPADAKTAAEYCRQVIVPSMDAIRSHADRLEELTAKKYWPFPTYSDMLFY